MRSELVRTPARQRGPIGALALVVGVALSCSSSDAKVGCEPTPSCSLRDERFAPPETADAGPSTCEPGDRDCHAIAVAAGGAHSCAIAEAGELVCWGSDEEGQRGDGLGETVSDAGVTDTDRDRALTARFPVVLDGVVEVTAGGAHTCARRQDGTVFCWGRNAEGQATGTASEQPLTLPRTVAVDGATQLDAGAAHTCAVTGEGVVCWGSARHGQSGREIVEGALAPGVVPGTEGAVEVSAGVRHTCARFASGRVACWGELLDVVTNAPRATAIPLDVPGLDDATAISAGAGHTCAIRQDATVVCWGLDDEGQLGDGGTRAQALPQLVASLPPALRIAAGGGERDGRLVGHTCAVDNGFFVQCWGRNVEGELGIGTATDSPQPVLVLERPGRDDEQPYLDELVAVSAGAFHTCALDQDGPVDCWGDDSAGQLGFEAGRRDEQDEQQLFGRAVRVGRFRRFF